jgi:general nucleoside transport system permease protein
MKAASGIRKQAFQQTLSLFSSIVVALILGFLLLALDGHTPGEVLGGAYSSTFSSDYRFANLIARLITIVLVALAAAIPFKAGIWNIGGDGQLLVGAFAAALVGIYASGLPAVIHVSLSVLAGAVGGALWASIPGWIRLKYNANEIVTTIMMNYLATLLTGYLVNYPFHSPGSSNAETLNILDSAVLPRLVPMSNLSTGLYITIFVFAVIYFIDKKTSWGYEWRAIGSNAEFSKYGGVNNKTMQFIAMCLGGALAGLAGSILVLGNYHKFIAGLGGGVGFTGVLIAVIASNSPIIILVIAIIFAILQNSIIGMQSKMGIAVEFSDIIQSVIILMVITRSKLWSSISNLFSRRKKYGNTD